MSPRDYTRDGGDAKIRGTPTLAIARTARIIANVSFRRADMPIYEFECNACGNVFDRLQKLSDPDPDTCPQCGKKKVRRCVTAPSFRLSGSGWYETDFKKDGDKKHNLASKDEAPKSESSKAEAKPETKPDVAKPAAGKADSVEKSKVKPAPEKSASTSSGNAG